jgi:hypothetical protein
VATVEQQIAVRIRAIVEGLASVQALSASVRDLNRPIGGGGGLRRTRTDVVNLGTSSNKTVKDLSALYTGTVLAARGFASGQKSVKAWTAELGNAARAIKPITDASRLLGPARSIQLPAGNPLSAGTVTLKPLVADIKAATVGTRALGVETSHAARQAKSLFDAYQVGTAASKKFIDDHLARSPKVRAEFEKLLAAGTRATGPASVARKVDAILPDDSAVQKRLLRFDTLIDGFIRRRKAGVEDQAARDLLNRRAGLIGFSPAQVTSRIQDRTPLIPPRALQDSATLTSRFNGATTAVFRLRAALVLVAAAITALAAAAGVFAIVKGLSEIVQEGVRFNSVLEDAKIGLAGIISNTFDIRDAQGNMLTGMDAYRAATGLAEQQMGKIRKATIETAFEFEDILKAVVAASSAVAGANVNLDKTIDLTVQLSRAASGIGLTPSELATQTRQILTGSTRVQTRLAQAIFPGESATEINKKIKAFREAGTLVEELEKRLAKFQFTANDIAGTFTNLTNNIGDAFKQFAGEATLQLFIKIKDILRSIINSIVDLSGETAVLTPTFQKIADILDVIGGAVGANLLRITQDISKWLTRIVDNLEVNNDEIRDTVDNLFAVLEHIVGIVVEFASAVFYANGLNVAMSEADQASGGLAITLATIRDFLNIINGIIRLIGASIQGLLVAPFILLESVVGSLSGRFGRLGDTINGLTSNVRTLFNSGFRELLSGASGENTRRTTKEVVDRASTVRATARGEINLGASATPIRGTGSGESDKDKADKKARELRRALNSMFDALEALQLAAADREIAVEKEKNKLLLEISQDRFDRGILSAKDFYKEKQRLELDDLKREEDVTERKKRIALNALQRQLSANLGRTATPDDVTAVRDAFRSTITGASTPGTKSVADHVKEYAETAKQLVELDKELELIEKRRQGVINATTRSLLEAVRATERLTLDIESELADSLGQGGISDTNELGKRASDDFGKILLDTNKSSEALESVASAINQLGSVTLQDIIDLLDLYGITVDSLDPRTQKWLKLLERKESVNTFTRLTSEAEKLRDALEFQVGGAEFGFEAGTATLNEALESVRALEADALPALIAKYEELRAKVSEPNASFTEKERQQLELLGRAIEKIKGPITELSLIRQAGDRAEAAAGAKIDDIENKRRAGTLTTIGAEKAVIAVKQELILELERELALLNAIQIKTPETLQTIADITNKIGTLRNETNSNILDLKEGITNSIGGAIEGFFDAVLAGNESILTSFRRVVAQMLIEIGKLIFQAFVMKAIMSSIQGFLGGFGGGGAAAAGGGAGAIAPFEPFAEGGYTGDGPASAPAGIVHRGEYVVPKRIVARPGMLGYLENMRAGAFLPKLRGYATGGLVGGSSGRSGGGAAGGMKQRIVNVLDKSIFSDYMNSAEGEEIILNIIGKNPGVVQRLA